MFNRTLSAIGFLSLVCCLPLQSAWSAEPVTFSVTADNRSASGFANVLNEIKLRVGGPGDFMVSPGDIDPPQATRMRLTSAFGADFDWYPAIGNHEAETASDMTYLRNYYWTYLDGNVNPGPAGSVETTYSFDAGPVHIAVINEYYNGFSDTGTNGDVVPALRSWLQSDLAASNKPWKLVFGHEPAYPQPDEDWHTARHVGDSLDAHPANRDAFWNLLEDLGVVAYVCGHTHRFSHYQPPGSEIWQIDIAQARGIGQYDTFMIVTADDCSIQFDVYRSLNQGLFSLTDSWVVPEPASLALLAMVVLPAVRRKRAA